MAPRKTTTKPSASQTSAAPVAATPTPVASPSPLPPSPQPTPTPAPDPNAALKVAVQQALAALDTAEAALNISDPPLTSKQKRHAAKLRKGGEKYVVQIGGFAKQYQLETAAMQVDTMLAVLGQADALQPLADALTTFAKHVGDSIFAAQSQAWDEAMQYYSLLKRRAKSSGDLANSLQPITDFLAYRHPSTKAPKGSPTKRQVNAVKKAQQTIATVAAGKLANTNLLNPRKHPAPTGEPAPTTGGSAAPTGSPAPSPATAGNGAPPAGAPTTNGGATSATHS
jgi:hypothetical protein